MQTEYHAKYFAYDLTRAGGKGFDRISQSLFNASVDLNPHQVEAALFALRSPLSKGVLLADEVGLGKTIEAGLVLCQYWAERKRHLLVVCPAALRKQWQIELEEKFNLPSLVLDAKAWRQMQKQGHGNPFYNSGVVISSYHYVSKMAVEVRKVEWDLVVIDEAHSVGAMGPAGRGVCAALGVLDDVDVMIGTFGKAFGSMGAFAITNKVIKEMLINRMRSFIFSTALPPVNARWTRFVLEKMPDFEERRKKLKRLSDAVRNVVTESGYQSLGDSHIVPLIVGDNGETLKLSGKLFESGILCGAVRPPTVPKGSARLRFSMNAALDEAVPERLREALS